MRTLITGGGGFIGSHLCERFLAEGHEVVCVDNFITGRMENLDGFRGHPKFTLIGHDISHPLQVKGPIDGVLHFASPASPVDYLNYPIQTLKVGSLGTHNALGLAKLKKARFLLASTSEVYGDPEVHPQREDYWGNVNPIGIRGCYDEAKRFSEAIVMAYHRAHGMDTKIVRIFNSVLGDQSVVVCDDDGLHLAAVEDYAKRLNQRPEVRTILVPAFNPRTLRMELRPASALIRHPARQEAYELRLRYGRAVKVTGDHSVFVEGPDGRPSAKFVRDIRPGEYVAIPARLPVAERDRAHIHLDEEFTRLAEQTGEWWDWAVRHPSLGQVVEERRAEIHSLLAASGRFEATANFKNTLTCTTRKWVKRGSLPLSILRRFNLSAPDGSAFLPARSSNRTIPNTIPITDDLLWLSGFYLAEGAEYSGPQAHFISLASDDHFLQRARSTLESHFGVHVGYSPATPGRAPSIYVHSKVLHRIFRDILGLRQRRIPSWVMQLPLGRVKYFLEGFRCGDGTHSGKKVGNELVFDTTSEALAIDLNYLLLRFGLIASFGRFETTFARRYGARRFPFYRLTLCALDNFDILCWDRGVRQTLNARRLGDLVWSKVQEIRPCVVTGYVYDFSVPGCENFVAGTGVCCHNTYGERMRLDDGRVLPNFMGQALRGEPLTVYGDGSQTRSFCYVSDLVEGIYRLLNSDFHEPVNLGNPDEVTILQFAEEIRRLAGAENCPIVTKPLPQDDPKVRKPDITRARQLLGWEPKVGRQEGLKRTYEYFRAKVAAGGKK